MVEILCTNDGKTRRVKPGSPLLELALKAYPEVTDPKTGKKYPTLAVLVDHKLKDLRIQKPYYSMTSIFPISNWMGLPAIK